MRCAPPAVSSARLPAPSGPPAATWLSRLRYYESSVPQAAITLGVTWISKPFCCDQVPEKVLQSALPLVVPSALKMMV